MSKGIFSSVRNRSVTNGLSTLMPSTFASRLSHSLHESRMWHISSVQTGLNASGKNSRRTFSFPIGTSTISLGRTGSVMAGAESPF